MTYMCAISAGLYLQVCVHSAFFKYMLILNICMHLIMIFMNYACGAVLFIQFLTLILPQTTLQRQVSGHLVVNKLELIDFNSGQHPSAKLSPGSELNKLPLGTVLRFALLYYVWQFRAQAYLWKTDLNSALLVQLFKNKRSKCLLNKLLNISKCIQQNVLYPMQINKSFNSVKVDLCLLGFYSYTPISTSAGVS